MENLKRSLGFIDSTAIVIGTIIGTGIFLKAASMSQLLPHPQHLFWAWAVAGFLSLAGALVYAELGELFPEAGGEFIYLKESYGEGFAFLYGWQRFWISSPGSIAAYAVGAATFLTNTFNFEIPHQQITLALIFIIAFSLLNCLSVSFGGKMQTFLTAIKLLMILGLVAGILTLSHKVNSLASVSTDTFALTNFSWSSFGAAVVAALWAFDGWNNLPMAAGEIKSPTKTIPMALILGTIIVFIVYILINYSFFYALPLHDIQTSSSSLYPQALPVATKAAQTFLGDSGVLVLSLTFVLSALGAMNGSILTSARVPYSMAHNQLFPKFFTQLTGKKSPYMAISIQALWSCALAVSGSFDQLTDYVVFSSWIFYALNSLAVMKLRKTLSSKHRHYKVPFYPYLPVLFSLAAFLLLVNTLIESPKESGMGLLIILLGIPFYYFFHKKK